MMAEKIKLFSSQQVSFEAIQKHFDEHPELWDKTHPEYGKQPRFVDYLTKQPLKSNERITLSPEALAELRELTKKFPLKTVTPGRQSIDEALAFAVYGSDAL